MNCLDSCFNPLSSLNMQSKVLQLAVRWYCYTFTLLPKPPLGLFQNTELQTLRNRQLQTEIHARLWALLLASVNWHSCPFAQTRSSSSHSGELRWVSACFGAAGTRVRLRAGAPPISPRLSSEPRQTFTWVPGLKRLPSKRVGKRRSRARSFVCLLNFVFRTLGKQIAREEGLSSLQTFPSLSKPSRPRFHILQLTAWILIGCSLTLGPNPCTLCSQIKWEHIFCHFQSVCPGSPAPFLGCGSRGS